MRIDWRDRGTWTALSLGVPFVFAAAMIVWGTLATARPVHLPDPNASPLIAVDVQGNAVPIAATIPPATPTPAPRAGFWRLEGVVVDELGAPLGDVCIAIGPRGCQKASPKTDQRGVFFFDFAQADVEYELHFIKDGFREIVRRFKPTSHTVMNVVLGR